jgi:hypothetical protein
MELQWSRFPPPLLPLLIDAIDDRLKHPSRPSPSPADLSSPSLSSIKPTPSSSLLLPTRAHPLLSLNLLAVRAAVAGVRHTVAGARGAFRSYAPVVPSLRLDARPNSSTFIPTHEREPKVEDNPKC